MKAMRVLVTGASGFVGVHLVGRLAAAGHEVCVLPSSGFRAARLAGLPYAVVSEADRARAELVYHLASTPLAASVDDCQHSRVIVGGMAQLLDRLRRCPPRLLVVAGSAAEYGPGRLCGEAQTLAPDTVFGMLKAAAWELARVSGMDAVLMRLFTPYGPGEAAGRLIPSAAAAAVAGARLRLRTTGEQTRDYVHVAEVAEALVQAGVRRPPLEPGVAINICSGVERRAIDVARQIFILAGRAPGDVAPGVEPPGELAVSSGNPGRARGLLNWRARLPFESGLREALAAAYEQRHTNKGDAIDYDGRRGA